MSEDARIALGLFAAIFVVSIFFLILRFAGNSDPAQQNLARAPGASSERPVTSTVAGVARSTLQEKPRSQPVVGSANTALASSASMAQSSGSQVSDEPLVPVIDPVPLSYFDPASNVLELPDVIRKYLHGMSNSALFMARLDSIVHDSSGAFIDDQQEPLMEFTVQSQTKRISYKSVHTTEWLEATFHSTVSPLTSSVLVDIWRSPESGSEGERLALFFASVQEYADKSGFAMNTDVVEEGAIVRVYALTDELPPIAKARLPQLTLVSEQGL